MFTFSRTFSLFGTFSYLTYVILLSCSTHFATGVRMQDLAILDQLLRKGYDRRATPTNHMDSKAPTHVRCEIFVRSLTSIDPLTMDYKADLYLRQKWKDERLKHENLTQPLDLNDPNLVKAIWKPEVYFPNAKEADFQFVTVPNVLIRIDPDGEILYMLRLKITFSCMMDLSKFPLDRQVCTMEVASFSKTVEELILEWKPDSPVTTGNLGMSQFELERINANKCHEETFQNSYRDIRNNYSCLVAEFHLSRSIGFHLVQSYLPTILMVVISWVSFWMDVNSVPGRVTLGVTTLLTVSSKATNIQENLPQTSYVKAIDIWMGTCTGFVFLALMEFIVVNYLWRKECCRRVRFIPAGNCTPDTQSKITGAKEVEGYDRSPMACSTIIQEFGGRSPRNSFIVNNHHNTTTNKTFSNPSPDQVSHHNVVHGRNSGPRGSHSSQHHHCHSDDDGQESGQENDSSHSHLRRLEHWQTTARTIDEVCRFAFPLAFCLFISIYSYYYYFAV